MTVKTCEECKEETAHFNGECAKCDPKFCTRCNIKYGSAEPWVAVGNGNTMHEDCYVKLLRELKPSRIPAGDSFSSWLSLRTH